MKLDAARFAIAVANVWAAAGLICGLFYKAAPAAYARGAHFLLHTDMFMSTRALGWGGLILAVGAWWILAALLAGSAAVAYNRLLGAPRHRHEMRGTH